MKTENIFAEVIQAVKDVVGRRRQLRQEQDAGANYWQDRARVSQGHGSLDAVAISAFLLTQQPEMKAHLDRMFAEIPPAAHHALRDRIREIQLSGVFRDETRDYSRSAIGKPQATRRSLG